MTPDALLALDYDELQAMLWKGAWRDTARDNQIPPPGQWSVFGALAGRGFGKTLLGGHWIGEKVYDNPGTIGHVIAPTFDDVLNVCFRGPSGILSHMPEHLIDSFSQDPVILKLKNGSIIRGFSAEKPARLRGPQCHWMWTDELAAWQYPEETWDMAMMGLRLGDHTQVVFTTTPKPTPLVKQLVADAKADEGKPNPQTIIVRGTTYDNRANLSANFFEKLIKQYEGTKLGRQELNAEIIDPEEAGIVQRSQFKLWPADKPLPFLEFIILSLDTAFTEKTRDKKSGDPDPTAGVCLGLFRHDNRDGVLVLDAWDDHLGMPDLITRTRREMDASYGDQPDPLIKPLYGKPRITQGAAGRKPDMLLIEDKGSGISLRQMLAQEGIFAHAYNPGRADKISRLHGVSNLFANGMVWVMESKSRPGQPVTWVDALISQLCSFTGEGSTKHDDYVDAMTQGLRAIVDQKRISVEFPRDLTVVETDYPRRQNPYAA
jgi:predicted phage terminase large subunit-like protein